MPNAQMMIHSLARALSGWDALNRWIGRQASGRLRR